MNATPTSKMKSVSMSQTRISTRRATIIRRGLLSLLIGLTLGGLAPLPVIGTGMAATAAQAGVLAAVPSPSAGQRVVQLADGSWLLPGSTADGRASPVATRVAPDGSASVLGVGMLTARIGYSAILLPDGSVLIFGGTDSRGQALASAERFDPATGQFTALANVGLTPRSGHSALVLADGSVLIAGGVDGRGRPVPSVERFDPLSQQVTTLRGQLDGPRVDAAITLLSDGGVLLSGGHDSKQQPVSGGVRIDPLTQQTTALDDSQVDALRQPPAGGVPSIVDSQPATEAKDVSVDRRLVVHFASAMDVASINAQDVTLLGPNGPVALKVVATDGGLLGFVTPQQDLLPGTRYTLFIKGARDIQGQALPFSAIGFNTARLGGTTAPSAVSALTTTTAGATQLTGNAGKTQSAVTPPSTPQAGAPESTGSLARDKLRAAQRTTDPEEWLPDDSNFHGKWRTRRAPSPLQDLPPLQAAPGVTALAGQALTLNGQPIAGVTVSIGEHRARTDDTGRFLLTEVPSGKQTLNIDGDTAQSGRYGFYQVLTQVTDQHTTALNYTIWLSKLDSTGTITIPSPTTSEVVLQNPHIPGLELHIPAGTVIRDRFGKIVTELNLTALPVDRPPFPLPNTGVPTYFTIQPGGAVLQSVDGQVAKGARLYYPNYLNQRPGNLISFWNYDAHDKGWYVYGTGHVSQDGKQVIPDPGVAIYEFTGAMTSKPQNAPKQGPKCGGASGGDPVCLATGLFSNEETDLVVTDVIPIEIRRSYRTQDTASRTFGVGTNLNYDLFLVGSSNATPTSGNAYTYQDLILPNGIHIHFPRTSPGTDFSDAVYTATADAGPFFGAVLAWNGNGWDLTLKNGTVYSFPDSDGSPVARVAAATGIRDRNGNQLTLVRDINSNLVKVVSPSGRYVVLNYDGENRVTQVTDQIGRTVRYRYDGNGRLVQVIDPLNNTESLTYDANDNMLTVTDKRNNVMVTNTYDANQRVQKQVYADGSQSSFTYTVVSNTTTQGQLAVCEGQPTTLSGPVGSYRMPCTVGDDGQVTAATYIDGRGNITQYTFNAYSQPIQVVRAAGTPEQLTTTYQYDPKTGLLLGSTDALNRTTTYSYDSQGNPLTVTALSGTPNAVTSTFTWTAFGQLASVKDPLDHTTMFGHDTRGNLTQIQDANNHTTILNYSVAARTTVNTPNGPVVEATTGGLLTKATDALGHSLSLVYDSSNNLVGMIDPLNRTATRSFDPLGRLTAATDPLGNQRQFSYDAQGQLAAITDPLGNRNGQAYDGNGNLTQFQDAKGGQHGYTYDPRNYLSAYTDPLNKATKLEYDGNHNLVASTDRNGQKTQFSYDHLDRLSLITYADGSTASFQYDAGNRVTRIVDSVNGTIGYTYDGLNRVTSATTPNGSIAYTYYANGLRQSMTVAGQPTLTYTYDPANRLTQMVQAAGSANNNVAQTVAYQYDDANRLTQKTLPNGVTVNYGYDAASQLTGIVYKQVDGSVIGDLSYGYDAAGRRVSRGGSFDRSTLPLSATGVTVDAANRLTAQNGATLSYDANGNLLSDGTNTYTWNVRNQLIQISNTQGVVATFSYDALGRRQGKTVNGTASYYVYDGANVVEQLAVPNGTIQAAYLTGLRIDETIAVQTGSDAAAQTASLLTDALGSTVRLTDGSGAKLVDYTYDPYGNTTADATVLNPFQYTGRENDGTGLYYYRARYYSPTLHRFISQDSTGINAGPNFYTYVGGNPVSFNDPFGLWKWGDPLPQGLVDFSAGFGDTLSFGLTNAVRDKMGTNGAVNKCSGAYTAGEVTGVAVGVVLSGAAGARAAAGEAGEEVQVLFKTEHYAERLEAAGVDVAKAEATVANEVKAVQGSMTEGAPFSGRIAIDGATVEYRAMPLPGGSVNVGTVFPVK
jgi:RHS repeat-associated protein